MQFKLNVRRYNPEADSPAPYWREYDVDVPETSTVLDCLIHIREYVDGTLAVRCSCRSAICGSCMVRVNGQARLACATKAKDMQENSEMITVEPGGNMPVLKDLIVDMDVFWNKIRQVKPWLEPVQPVPEREYLVPNETILDLTVAMNCIMCGACVSDCTSLEVDKNFLGPAALAKAYRFVDDPRDDARQERLEELSDYGGVYDCTHCFFCVEVCPKGVAPLDRIVEIRERAQHAGVTNNAGTRHAKAFEGIIRDSGILDEPMLLLRSIGMNPVEQVKNVPGGLRLLRAGKLPLASGPFHHKIPDHGNVKRLFEKVDSAQGIESAQGVKSSQ